jgi:transposase-like protein
MRGQKHSDETRSQALAALLEGQGIAEVARKYDLPHSTVRDIKKSIRTKEFAKVRAKKEESLSGLIEGHLQASLKAATNIANQASNADWLNKQDADKLGVFYGIVTDKSVRILEAAEAAQGAGDEPEL